MPVSKCNNGKWRIGSGDCIYETKEKAEEVWRAILASYGKSNINGKGISTEQSHLREEEGRKGSEEQKQKQS